MKRILISGYYGFNNAGDEAMLAAIAASLKKELPDARLTVISGDPEATRRRFGVDSVGRFEFPRLLRAAWGSDLLISGGGSLLQDVTSSRSLFYYLSVILMGLAFSGKVMLYAQGIGPIRGRLSRRVTGLVLAKADLITVRDMASLEELKRLGAAGKARVTADAVLALPAGSAPRGREILRRFGVIEGRKVIAFSVRPWGKSEAYLREIAMSADILAAQEGAAIVLLPMQRAKDLPVLEAVRDLMREKGSAWILDADFSTEEYLDLAAAAGLVVGMRLHALVFAALAGTPFAALSYDPKVAAFCREAGGVLAASVEDGRGKVLEGGALAAASIAAKAHAAMGSSKGENARLENMRRAARENARLAAGLLNGESQGEE